MKSDHLSLLLAERGVSDPDVIVADLDSSLVDDAVQLVGWFDRQRPGTVGKELLVWKIKRLQTDDYKPPEERTAAGGSVPAQYIKAVRDACISPDGFGREEMEMNFESWAQRFGVSSKQLVDLAMGTHWQLTPEGWDEPQEQREAA